MTEISLIVTTAFSGEARASLVNLRVGDTEIQMLPERARILMAQLADKAEQAESETAFVDFLISKWGLKPGDARAALAEFRHHRNSLRDA